MKEKFIKPDSRTDRLKYQSDVLQSFGVKFDPPTHFRFVRSYRIKFQTLKVCKLYLKLTVLMSYFQLSCFLGHLRSLEVKNYEIKPG